MSANKISRSVLLVCVMFGVCVFTMGKSAFAQDYTGMDSVALLDALGKDHPVTVHPAPRGSYGGLESTALVDAVNKDYGVKANGHSRKRDYTGMDSTALLDALSRDARTQSASSERAFGMIHNQ